MKNGKALVFDFNGTLFWDNPYNRRAWDAMSVSLRGRPFTQAEREAMNGKPDGLYVRFLLGREPDAQTIARISEEKEREYLRLCLEGGTPSLAPGAEALIDEASRQGIPLAIATGAPAINVAAYREWFPILARFNHIIYDDGTFPGKPEPDIWLLAYRALSIAPSDAIVFEDSRNGVVSALRSGAGEVWVVQGPECDPTVAHIPGISGVLRDFSEFKGLFPPPDRAR